MTEEKKKTKERLIINIIDGTPCIYLQPGIISRRLPPPQVIPFHFATVQEFRTNEVIPDILKEFTEIFKNNHWGFTRIDLLKQKEDKKDDNEERERKTD